MEVAITDLHQPLIEMAKISDRGAQFELYKLYSKPMLNVSNRIVNNIEEAENVLQESFISAFNNINSYRGDSTFGSWLKRIVVNNSINVLRKNKFEFSEIDGYDAEYEEDNENYSELSVDHIRSAIELLPHGFKMVLSLYLL